MCRSGVEVDTAQSVEILGVRPQATVRDASSGRWLLQRLIRLRPRELANDLLRGPASFKSNDLEVNDVEEKSLYDRLGGVFAIAAVVDHFSDAIIKNARVGELSENPQLREWSTAQIGRLPGLKFMRTLWVCNISGGPFQYSATVPGSTVLGLEEAHRRLRITPEEFDEVAAELGRTLDLFKVPEREKGEVLGAFAAHKGEVTEGSLAA